MSDLSAWSTLVAAAVGAGSGMLSALAGVGGAVVSTPGIRVLGATPLEAVGSTVPAIIPGALTGSIRYARAGLIDWPAGLTCGLAGATTSVLGAWTSDRIEGGWLMVLTALLVLWSSSSVLRRRHQVPAADDTGVGGVGGHNWSRLMTLGCGAGFVAGLLGVGGGIVLVPAFRRFLRLDVKRTIATSLVAVALMSCASLVAHTIEGHIAWRFAVPLILGVIPGARLGSRIAVAASERTMRLTCGSLLLVLGSVYLITEVAAL